MSDNESRHRHIPTVGGGIFAEIGSETVENDQTGLPPWAAALIAQLQTTLAAQLTVQAQAHRAELLTYLDPLVFSTDYRLRIVARL